MVCRNLIGGLWLIDGVAGVKHPPTPRYNVSSYITTGSIFDGKPAFAVEN
jgi:hypothetical protein